MIKHISTSTILLVRARVCGNAFLMHAELPFEQSVHESVVGTRNENRHIFALKGLQPGLLQQQAEF